MKYYVLFVLFFLMGIVIGALIFFLRPQKPGIDVARVDSKERILLFPKQCIDTMKVSRDKARLIVGDPENQAIVAKQVAAVKALGATCIAIGTPYDEEFVPYMTLWVTEARRAGLSVWFRGNWAEWEGWFSYKKDLTPEEHVKKTVAFIQTHKDLFRDGDIFSASVEPENGWPFHPVDSQEKIIKLREFLLIEEREVKKAFVANGTDVTTNWISMSGGVARSIIDSNTLDVLSNTVTLDHYVSNPEGISEFVNHFTDPLGARIVFGEFGAPIPDLNGEMTEVEQADFVEKLFWELYKNKTAIDGVNYWTLTESSTALYNQDMTARKVTSVVRRFYNPGAAHIKATDNHGRAIQGVIVMLQNEKIIDHTDKKGEVEIILPQDAYELRLISPTGRELKTTFTIQGQDIYSVSAVFPR